MTITERANVADRAIKLLQAARDRTPDGRRSSGCILVRSERGYELVLEHEEGALARLSGLLRSGGTALALLACSPLGEVSATVLEHDVSPDDSIMAQVRETFEAIHHAGLLYASAV